MNNGETVLVPSPYKGCTGLIGKSFCFIFLFAQDASKIYAIYHSHCCD